MAKLTTEEARELSLFDDMVDNGERMTSDQAARYRVLVGKWDEELYEIRERQREIYDPRDDED